MKKIKVNHNFDPGSDAVEGVVISLRKGEALVAEKPDSPEEVARILGPEATYENGKLTIHTSNPGVWIGRRGWRVRNLRKIFGEIEIVKCVEVKPVFGSIERRVWWKIVGPDVVAENTTLVRRFDGSHCQSVYLIPEHKWVELKKQFDAEVEKIEKIQRELHEKGVLIEDSVPVEEVNFEKVSRTVQMLDEMRKACNCPDIGHVAVEKTGVTIYIGDDAGAGAKKKKVLEAVHKLRRAGWKVEEKTERSIAGEWKSYYVPVE